MYIKQNWEKQCERSVLSDLKDYLKFSENNRDGRTNMSRFLNILFDQA